MRVSRIWLGFTAVVLSGFLLSCGSSRSDSPSVPTAPVTDAVTYSATLVAEKVWRIIDSGTGSSNIYLVEGEQKALLIDTGLGNGRLAEFVRSLTKLPVSVVCTHNHSDHVGGSPQFNDLYGHQADFASVSAFHVFEDGYQFDLGGRTLEVIWVPGHTRGSVSLLDSEHKLLFTGDNPNQWSWVFLPDSAPLEGYLETLRKLEQRGREYNTVLPGHGDPSDSSLISGQIACAQSILGGSCTAAPDSNSYATSSTMRCTVSDATIVYDLTRLRLSN